MSTAVGYDMYFTDPLTKAEEVALEAAEAAISAAVHPSHLPEGPEREAAWLVWDAMWEARDEAMGHYFRLNIWGMGSCRKAMAKLGMLTEQDHPAWPDPVDFGLPKDDPWGDGENEAEGGDALAEARERFEQAQKGVVEAEPQPVTGIPLYKLCSNDGWLVTPAEIKAALTSWEAADESDRRTAVGEHDWFPEWIDWLGKAKERGGFRVY
ncbi:hypothetical protein ABT093_19705 [Kitasatospora sp. NPDC002551]|uniref:hypothetical protein n=1 Tax=Kitasatospora sp. NPDC002551 TaxID=3154539 RepID=UPI00331C277E